MGRHRDFVSLGQLQSSVGNILVSCRLDMADVGGVKEKRSKKGKKKGAAESSAEKAESQIATEKQCMEDSKLEGKPLEVERGEPVDDTQQDGMESASEQKGAERGKSQAASGDGGEKEEGSTARAAEEEFPHTPAPSIAPSADATSSAEQVGGIVQDGEAGNKAGEKEESCDSQPAVEAASTDSHGKILREDEDCFLAGKEVAARTHAQVSFSPAFACCCCCARVSGSICSEDDFNTEGYAPEGMLPGRCSLPGCARS